MLDKDTKCLSVEALQGGEGAEAKGHDWAGLSPTALTSRTPAESGKALVHVREPGKGVLGEPARWSPAATPIGLPPELSRLLQKRGKGFLSGEGKNRRLVFVRACSSAFL